jgi:hypothetical protein
LGGGNKRAYTEWYDPTDNGWTSASKVMPFLDTACDEGKRVKVWFHVKTVPYSIVYIVLHEYTTLCCAIQCYTIIYYILYYILYYTILYYTILYYNILYYNILYYTIYYIILLYNDSPY